MVDEVTYDIETQAAAAITNIGGDQTIYAGERRSPIPRLLSLTGLTLSLTALGLLVYTGVNTANELLANDFWPSDVGYYTDAIASTWQPAVILLVAGIVLSRVGRALGRQ
jgi:hypothetical protein